MYTRVEHKEEYSGGNLQLTRSHISQVIEEEEK
jgi:hypothetical protein